MCVPALSPQSALAHQDLLTSMTEFLLPTNFRACTPAPFLGQAGLRFFAGTSLK